MENIRNTDGDVDLSNVKRLDIWTVVRTILEKNPGIKGGQLWQKVREKTGLSRSTIYEHLNSFDLQNKIYRNKGRCWLEKPNKEKLKDVTALQLLNQLEEKLGSRVDLTALNLLVDRLNSLLHSGAHVSPREAETAKLDIDIIIAETKMRTKRRERKAALDLLDALKVYLRLVVDSLVKR